MEGAEEAPREGKRRRLQINDEELFEEGACGATLAGTGSLPSTTTSAPYEAPRGSRIAMKPADVIFCEPPSRVYLSPKDSN